jgi:exopolysaccharide biosynthesis polyprenyl glycosylphosphotransferase
MKSISQSEPILLTTERAHGIANFQPRTADEMRIATVLAPQIEVVARGLFAERAKRLFDVFSALIAILLLAPLLTLAALAVKLTSDGPVLFSQMRVGKGGRLFRFYKFRSMVTDSETLKASLMTRNEKDGPIFKMQHDPRITPVGRFLRKYSIDELPQLLNVLNGDMSLVGPRPPVPAEVVQYEEWQLRRLSVAPGLTCIWQTSGRSRITFDEWMRMDLEYIDTWSFGLDLKLLLKTVKAVLVADGAY